jgi:hypothetical protein
MRILTVFILVLIFLNGCKSLQQLGRSECTKTESQYVSESYCASYEPQRCFTDSSGVMSCSGGTGCSSWGTRTVQQEFCVSSRCKPPYINHEDGCFTEEEISKKKPVPILVKSTANGITSKMLLEAALLVERGDLKRSSLLIGRGKSAEKFLELFRKSESASADDFDKLMEELRSMAGRGNVRAQFSLGLMAQYKGKVSNAIDWYGRAANRGHAAAQYNLGLYLWRYKQGIYDRIKWWEEAAWLGDPTAQHDIGKLYLEDKYDRYTKQDAYFWLYLAAMNGFEDAAGPRDTLAQKMTPEKIGEVQRKLKEFSNKQVKRAKKWEKAKR